MKIINNKWLQLILVLGILAQFTGGSAEGFEVLVLIAALVILLPFTRSKLGLDQLDKKFKRHQGKAKSSNAKPSSDRSAESAPAKVADVAVTEKMIPDIEAALESFYGQLEEFVFDNLGSVVPPDASATLFVEWESERVKLLIGIDTYEGAKKVIDGEKVFLVSNFDVGAIAKAIEKAFASEINAALAPFGLTLKDVQFEVRFFPSEGW